MLVPSTRLFSAGELETGAYMNSAVTNLGNFILGKPVAELYTTATTALVVGTPLAIAFTNEVIDRDNGHSTSTNTTRYTAQTAGWYYVFSNVIFSAVLGTNRYIYHTVNAATYNGSLVASHSASAQILSISNSSLMYLNVGDYVETYAATNTNCNLAAVGSPSFPNTATMSVIWVSS